MELGKPDAGKPPVRFEEGREADGHWPSGLSIRRFLPTLHGSCVGSERRWVWPVEFSGAVYHVTARGNERKRIYRDDADRRSFLSSLAEAIEEHGSRLHGYCLMPNHYHLLVETPRSN